MNQKNRELPQYSSLHIGLWFKIERFLQVFKNDTHFTMI